MNTNASTTNKILAVGKQSPRKGIFDIIRAMREVEMSNDLANMPSLFLSGSLDLGEARNQKVGEQLEKLQRLFWRKEYVSDAEMLSSYSCADYVIIPYDRSFDGSSGVFAYATALGKPIISTNHGCIGARVNKFGMGYTYTSGSHEELAHIFSKLPHPTSQEYKELSRKSRIYSLIYSKLAFKCAFSKKIGAFSLSATQKANTTVNSTWEKTRQIHKKVPRLSIIEPLSFSHP
jgi:glycosyltransferase involved in cell wall biosynthesis